MQIGRLDNKSECLHLTVTLCPCSPFSAAKCHVKILLVNDSRWIFFRSLCGKILFSIHRLDKWNGWRKYNFPLSETGEFCIMIIQFAFGGKGV